MKRIIFAFFFVFVTSLFLVPTVNTAQAFGIGCATFPPGFNLPSPCACALSINCASGICFKPIGSPLGICLPQAKQDTGDASPVSLKKVHYPPPMPPCAVPLDRSGKCTSVLTSLGNIETEPGAFISRLFAIMLAVSGAVAVILIMRAGYKIMTARGNPEGINQGREQLVSAIVGLMFLVFSFVLLQVISVDLLKIPGFTGGGSAPKYTCGSTGTSCKQANDCYTNGGYQATGYTGCRGDQGQICCKPSGGNCSDFGGVCLAHGACDANDGVSKGTLDCGNSKICCAPK